MAGLIEDDTDVEMGRYNEAYQIKTYSGLSPSNMRGASVQYDPVNKTEAVYVDLPSGGKLRIGDRPVTPTQVAETDVAKAADVPVSEDIDTFAKNYKSNPSNIGGKDPSFDDYDMAGYSQAEILQYEKSRTEQYMAQPNIADVVKLTPDQTSQYAAQPDAEMISDYQPPGMFEGAVSETVKGLARGGLVNPSKFLKENFNLYDPLVFQIVDPKTGEFDPQLKIVSREEKAEIDRAIAAGEMPFALDFEQLVQSDTEAGPGAKMIGGLSQFVGAFAGVGKLFKVGSGLVGAASQGAAADFLGFEGNEGRLTDLLLELGVPENRVTDFLRTDPNDPDYVGRFKNALEGGVLGVIADQIAPVYRMIKEGGSKTELGQAIGDLRFQSRQLFSDRLSDVIGAGRAIAQGDTEMLGEVFQRGRPPQSLSAGAVDTETAGAITAFHGSPYDFDAFDIGKMGTGEGNQAYGPGLYFAEAEGVAKEYRDSMLDARIPPLNDKLKELSREMNEISSGYRQWKPGQQERGKELSAEYDKLLGERSSMRGRLYQVNIKANPEDFLNWDAPISQQSEKVRQVLMPFVEQRIAQMGEAGNRFTAEQWMDRLRGGDVMLLDKVGDTPVSKAMVEAGVPGVRYLDQASRRGGDGTRNYVVFDDQLVDIVKKYGVAGLAVGAAVQSELGVNEQIEESI